jgi:hypothetical protein
MHVHVVQDLGQEELIKAHAPLKAACGRGLGEAHEVARPESEQDFCPDCLSWTRRNKFQNFRCAVDLSPAPMSPA